MKVLDYFESSRKEHWLNEIKRSDWRAGEFLYELIRNGSFFKTLGNKSTVLLLTDGDELISFCTYAEKDDIQPTELTPWAGFVYTFPEHRGNRYAGLLFEKIGKLAENEGIPEVYLSTNHVGLYEKYGFKYLTELNDIEGNPSRIYVKGISDKYIACCGLDCETCEARIATVTDDESLREKVAKEWSALNQVEITPEMINCNGCRMNGAKTPFCDSLCPIRQCAKEKGNETCGECGEINSCKKLEMITGNNEEALKRLKENRY